LTAYRDWAFRGLRGVLLLWAATWAAGTAAQTAPDSLVPSSPAVAAQTPGPRPNTWVAVTRAQGRLRAAELGLVINTADSASVQVGEYYIAARGLLPWQVLRIDIPVRPVLNRDEFEHLVRAIDKHFGTKAQALALAWTAPYAVECNSITGALALGFDAELCKHTCGPSRPSRYFDSASARPLGELGIRPSMLLAAPTVDQAKALIDRGVAADGALALRGRPPVKALLLTTDDLPRRVRTVLYPPPGLLRAVGVEVQVVPAADLASARRVLMVTTGSVRAPVEPAPDWVPGGLGDHLTSYGGDLLGTHGHGTALDWIASGATASYGTVSEPCNHLQKFPHPQLLLGHYLQGETAIEAYWKSVAWPQQGLFVGEPLSAPFSRQR
jgi:uncharacterized protein (TIGR03790 family)